MELLRGLALPLRGWARRRTTQSRSDLELASSGSSACRRVGQLRERDGARDVLHAPRWYRDPTGAVHRDGVLRSAKARDELRALGDFRVHLRPEAFLDVVLPRVIVRLGGLALVDAGVVERLTPADREVLERAYREMNGYPVRAHDPADGSHDPAAAHPSRPE